MTIGDIITSLSDTSRNESEEAISRLGIDPDKEVLTGPIDNADCFKIRGVDIEQITPHGNRAFEGINPDNDPELAKEMKTEESFDGIVLGA